MRRPKLSTRKFSAWKKKKKKKKKSEWNGIATPSIRRNLADTCNFIFPFDMAKRAAGERRCNWRGIVTDATLLQPTAIEVAGSE